MNRRRQRFQPPRQRNPRRTGLWAPSADWRSWILPISVRATIAIAFGAIPTIQPRFGEISLVLICLASAGLAAVAIGWEWRNRGGPLRRDLLADVMALLVLVPVVEVATGIQIADARFGGRLPNVLAGLGAALAVFMMVILLVRTVPPLFRTDPSIAVLPAALIIAAGLGGAHLFTTAQFWQGMSVAWAVAAIATLIYGLGPPQLRSIVSIVAFTLFTLALVALAAADEGGPNVNPTASRVSIVALVAVALLLLATAIPPAPRRRNRPRPPAESMDTPTDSRDY